MKLEVSLHLVRHNNTVLVWEVSKSDHMTEKVPMAYTTEMDKKGKS